MFNWPVSVAGVCPWLSPECAGTKPFPRVFELSGWPRRCHPQIWSWRARLHWWTFHLLETPQQTARNTKKTNLKSFCCDQNLWSKLTYSKTNVKMNYVYYLWVCKVCSQHLSDVLCVWEIKSGVHFIQDVNGSGFEQQHS